MMPEKRKIAVSLILGFAMGIAVMGIQEYINSPVGVYTYKQHDCELLLQAEKLIYDHNDYRNDSYFMRMWEVQNCNRFYSLEEQMKP